METPHCFILSNVVIALGVFSSTFKKPMLRDIDLIRYNRLALSRPNYPEGNFALCVRFGFISNQT